MRLPYLAFLLAAWPGIGGVLARDDPKFASQKFDEPPQQLVFFDDSETALALMFDGKASEIYMTEGAGDKWDIVKEMPKGEPYFIHMHPTDKDVAVILGRARTHWITYTKGKEWRSFKTEQDPSAMQPIHFHAKDSKKIIFQDMELCDFFTASCLGNSYYTNDGFATSPKLLLEGRKDCLWAKSTDRFTTQDDALDNDRVVCVAKGKFSNELEDQRILISDDYFKSSHEAKMGGRIVYGMANVAAVKGYMVAAAKAEGSKELALYVTDDTKTWHRAEFGGHRIEEDAYTVLESTNYSIQVDVRTSNRANMGVLFSSNSNGTYFTPLVEHTNRNERGIVDFEKVTDIQGIMLVNTVANADEVENSFARKIVRSAISFDDGRTFEDLKVGDSRLHLHSVSEQKQDGKVFTSTAPGMVLGVGNTGNSLGNYKEGDLFVSDDAGLTWHKALDGSHLYEFGGQGSVIVAVKDEAETGELAYSINHGKDWSKVKFPNKEELFVYSLTTIPDSTSLKFVLTGVKKSGSDIGYRIYSIDFAGLHERDCKDGDFEEWSARVDSDGKATCIMGHTQTYRRRKADAECLVNDEFNEAKPTFKPCDCSDQDFECDYNFKLDRETNKCEPAGALRPPKGACAEGDKEFKGSSGWRLIPGNDCKRTSGKQKDDPVERPCADTKEPVSSGEITHKAQSFKRKVVQYHYLEHKIQDEDETAAEEAVVVLTEDGIPHLSRDHGKSWKVIEEIDGAVLGLYPHSYDSDTMYVITASERIWYTKNRGKQFNYITAPEPPPNQRNIQIMMFHHKQTDWLMWIGGKDCKGGADPNCHTVAHVSTNGGEEWKAMLRYVQKCQFVSAKEKKTVLCQQHADEDVDAPLQLVGSNDWFVTKEVYFKDVVDFASMSEFVVVASKTEDKKWLTVDASVNGETFAKAEFPPGFQVPQQQAYTVLDSSTHAVFMHVTVNAALGQEYGTIIKSNSNGTSYVLSISNVNRNVEGYVDFEKIAGLEGVAIINQVANVEDVDNGARKKLKTKITHNDGAEWDLLPPPKVDSSGNKYACAGKGTEKCSIHFHGYSERADPRSTFGSASAIGLVMGYGNVGEFLSDENTETFMSSDGGLSWKAVMAGHFMWEYGDQGSVVVIVKTDGSTRELFYTLDEGETWNKYRFADRDVDISSISTVPSDNSRNFLLWGKDFAINVDFSGLTSRQCNLDEDNPDSKDSDYLLWAPKHPKQKQKDCLFGHKALYYRKKTDRKCYNGPMIQRLHSRDENCECTRQDFECAYNFERQSDGSCALVEGLQPADASAVCKADPNLVTYWDVSAYRKIPISTCEGGKEMAYTGESHPCPGHEKEYAEKHRLSGVALFFAIVVPIAVAAAVGYWVWEHWGGKLGQIRLGDGIGGGIGGGFDRDSRWVQWPVAAISGVVAVVAAIPLLAASLWRSASGWMPVRGGGRVGGYGQRTYTSRSSFARGRADYTSVDADEGELLGEDSDEDV